MAGREAAGTATGREHLDTLDSLRGFAALSVCLYHLTSEGRPEFLWETARRLFSWGWAGVDVFFVISGFIIPYTMVRDRYRLRDFGRFAGRRLLRVGPPSWILLLACVGAYFALDAVRGTGPHWSAGIGWARVLHNLAFTIPFTHYAWINLVLWTLAVEFQFYLLVGLAFPFAFRGRWPFLAATLVLCLLHYVPLPAGLIFMKHAMLFSIGGAALIHREGWLNRWAYLAVLALLGLVCWRQVGPVPAAFGCATALVISFVPLRSRLGGFLGRISYSLYLVHTLAGLGTTLLLMRLIQPASPPAKLLIIVAGLAVSIATAWLFHRALELPFVRLAKGAFGARGRAEADPPL